MRSASLRAVVCVGILLTFLATGREVRSAADAPTGRAGFVIVERDVGIGTYERHSELFRVREDGLARRRLTWSVDAESRDADVTRDGRRIAFVRYDGDELSVWVMGADGSRPRRLSGIAGSEVALPKWSPDARRLVVQTDAPCPFETHEGCVALWVVDPDGPLRRRLAETYVGTSPVAVSWAPGGRAIAFEHRPGNAGSFVAVAGIGGGLRTIAPGYGPAFAPRDHTIAFVQGGRIATIHDDGRGMRPVSRPPAGWRDDEPTWSPDGRRLAFWRLSLKGRPARLVVVDVEALRERSFPAGAVVDPYPTNRILWSPDGSRLAVTLPRGTSRWVYRLNLSRRGGLVPWLGGTLAGWARA